MDSNQQKVSSTVEASSSNLNFNCLFLSETTKT